MLSRERWDMFDLDSKNCFDKATKFYEYAKALAILRENYLRYEKTAKDGDILNRINDAIRALIKQVHEYPTWRGAIIGMTHKVLPQNSVQYFASYMFYEQGYILNENAWLRKSGVASASR